MEQYQSMDEPSSNLDNKRIKITPTETGRMVTSQGKEQAEESGHSGAEKTVDSGSLRSTRGTRGAAVGLTEVKYTRRKRIEVTYTRRKRSLTRAERDNMDEGVNNIEMTKDLSMKRARRFQIGVGVNMVEKDSNLKLGACSSVSLALKGTLIDSIRNESRKCKLRKCMSKVTNDDDNSTRKMRKYKPRVTGRCEEDERRVLEFVEQQKRSVQKTGGNTTRTRLKWKGIAEKLNLRFTDFQCRTRYDQLKRRKLKDAEEVDVDLDQLNPLKVNAAADGVPIETSPPFQQTRQGEPLIAEDPRSLEAPTESSEDESGSATWLHEDNEGGPEGVQRPQSSSHLPKDQRPENPIVSIIASPQDFEQPQAAMPEPHVQKNGNESVVTPLRNSGSAGTANTPKGTEDKAAPGKTYQSPIELTDSEGEDDQAPRERHVKKEVKGEAGIDALPDGVGTTPRAQRRQREVDHIHEELIILLDNFQTKLIETKQRLERLQPPRTDCTFTAEQSRFGANGKYRPGGRETEGVMREEYLQDNTMGGGSGILGNRASQRDVGVTGPDDVVMNRGQLSMNACRGTMNGWHSQVRRYEMALARGDGGPMGALTPWMGVGGGASLRGGLGGGGLIGYNESDSGGSGFGYLW